MRSKKTLKNVMSGLLLQIVQVLCGFILPRLILKQFGSTYNGMVSSITQFLQYGNLLSVGIGATTSAALYKPLAEKDYKSVSAIVNATNDFMKHVTLIFSGAVLVFACTYYFFVDGDFTWGFCFTMVIVLSINSFANYLWGNTYRTLLTADMKRHIVSYVGILATVLSTVLASVSILLGASIQMVKLISSICFAMQPAVFLLYTKKYYKLDRKVEANKYAINQRWDAFAHQIANFVHSNTDIIILTFFLPLEEVSVYTVYAMVISSLKRIVSSSMTGTDAAFGDMIAKKQTNSLQKSFSMMEFFCEYVSSIIYCIAIVMIVPFVQVYTRGVNDANYVQPVFALIFCVAEMFFGIRTPYQAITYANGDFKQTKNGAIVEPIINIVISLVLVKPMGYVGVAIGTLVAMIYRTIQYAYYSYNNILNKSIIGFWRKMFLMAIRLIMGIFVAIQVEFPVSNYVDWIILAIIRTIIILGINILFAIILQKEELLSVFLHFKKALERNK